MPTKKKPKSVKKKTPQAQARKLEPVEQQLMDAIQASLKQGVTRYRIAADARMSPIGLDRWIKGERGLNFTSAARIAHALGLELRPKTK
jgi:hypothetical protein